MRKFDVNTILPRPNAKDSFIPSNGAEKEKTTPKSVVEAEMSNESGVCIGQTLVAFATSKRFSLSPVFPSLTHSFPFPLVTLSPKERVKRKSTRNGALLLLYMKYLLYNNNNTDLR